MRIAFAFLIVAILSEESDGCRMGLVRIGFHAVRNLFGGIRIDLSEKKSNAIDEEEEELRKIKSELKTRILPDSEIYKTDNSFFMGMNDMYTHFTGCYEEGRSMDYRGRMDFTETGRRCAKWSIFTDEMQAKMSELIKTINTRNFSLNKLELTDEERKAYRDNNIAIAVLNQTTRILKEKGHVFHNYCRDPDGIGKPWCLVKSKRGIEWERCPVPVCTACWRILHRSTFKLLRMHPTSFNVTYPWMPKCDLNGKFEHTQCWESYCWCSTESGNIVPGTLRDKKNGTYDCDKLLRKAQTSSKRRVQEKERQQEVTREKIIAAQPSFLYPHLFKSQNEIEKVATELKSSFVSISGRLHFCQRAYYLTRELLCKKDKYCLVVRRKRLYEWTCLRSLSPMDLSIYYVTSFSRIPSDVNGPRTYFGDYSQCHSVEDVFGDEITKCKTIRRATYHIRNTTPKRKLCMVYENSTAEHCTDL